MHNDPVCYMCLEQIVFGETLEMDVPALHWTLGWQKVPTQSEPAHMMCRRMMEEFEIRLIQHDEDDLSWILEQTKIHLPPGKSKPAGEKWEDVSPKYV